MSSRTVLWPAALLVLGITIGPQPARAQKPAPVEDVSSFPHRKPDEERKALHVPPGFEIQLVAAEPEIQKPLNLAFDDRGRLWVTDTVEYPYPAKEGTKPRDTVKILAGFGPDGRARSIQTFADGLNIPIGVLPLPSATAALVHSIPDIFLLRDRDGDGRADLREILYGVFGHDDTHGMTSAFTWGLDGWVYACHGYANDSTVEGKDRRPISMNSGNTYRMRPDGSHAEYVTHGQVNPFGLAFDPLGNLYSCDCHSRPVYQLLRGAWYPSFGKPHDGLGFGPEMLTHDHGSTGIGGISYYAAEQFPEAYRGTIFVGNVVTNRINHDRIEWHGSTPKGIEQPDFVWSEDNWFRPVDIELGPEGALYVADFYNRIIGHYEVPLTHPGRDRTSGRIWRIVYRGLDGKLPPPPGNVDRTQSAVEELAKDLSDPNLAVRISAGNQLVERGGDQASVAMRTLLPRFIAPTPKVLALWVLQRRGVLDDQAIVACHGSTADRRVLVHILRILAERPELSEWLHELAIDDLAARDPFVQRAAAEALGAHPALINIKPLLALRQSVSPEDTHLLHVARMALRDQLKSADVWPKLETLGLSERDRRDLADVATGVTSPGAAAFLLAHIRALGETHDNLLRYMHHAARRGPKGTQAKLLAVVLAADRSPADRLSLLQAIQQGIQERNETLDAEVRKRAGDLCRKLLAAQSGEEVAAGIQAAGDFQLGELIHDLKRVAGRADLTESRRGEALRAIAAIDPAGGVALLRGLVASSARSIEIRESAAISLANLDRPEALDALLEALPTANERLQSTIAAALARRREGAFVLFKAIEAGKASARLLQERRVVIGLENAEIPQLSQRIAALLAGLPPADRKLKELLGSRRDEFLRTAHNPARGAGVFEKKCANCHQLGGKGARVGPQLDGIGSRGLERLLEDVLDPNRNVDQSFRVTNLALDNGQVVSGLLLREEGEVLIVADSEGKEVRVPKKQIEERTTIQLSPMPANLADQIPEAEFQDLMAYLLSHREETKSAPAVAH
jgi:putative heme-binding domain-containing protein